MWNRCNLLLHPGLFFHVSGDACQPCCQVRWKPFNSLLYALPKCLKLWVYCMWTSIAYTTKIHRTGSQFWTDLEQLWASADQVCNWTWYSHTLHCLSFNIFGNRLHGFLVFEWNVGLANTLQLVVDSLFCCVILDSMHYSHIQVVIRSPLSYGSLLGT
jgi:hypothetical protein